MDRREPPPPPVRPEAISAALAAEIDNPLRRMGMIFSLVFIFFRFSQLHELMMYTFGFNTYILYVFGPTSIALALLSGGLRRLFASRIAWMWVGFVFWMLISTPFSFWRADSIVLLTKYLRTEFPCLLLIAGLCVTWVDIRNFLIAIGLSAICNMLVMKTFLNDSSGRIYLEFGSMANANDFAAHLILVMPFLLLGVLWPKQYFVVRIATLALITYGLYLVLGTGSRGALVALLVASGYALLRGTNQLRMVAVLLAPFIIFSLVTFLPDRTKDRLWSLFSSSEETSSDAAESRDKRSYLLTQSIKLTFSNPLLGVGVGQFMNYEGDQSKREGIRGAWQVSHNSYTQVSSELGIPGLFFFLAAILSTFVLASRLQKQAKGRPEWKAMEMSAFCVTLSLLGFSVAIFFLSLAYHFYLPTMSALVIAMASVMRNQIALTSVATPAAAAPKPPWMNRPNGVAARRLS